MRLILNFSLALFCWFCMAPAWAGFDFGARVTTGEMIFASNVDEDSYVETELLANYNLSEALELEASAFGRFTDGRDYWGFQATTPLKLQLPGGFMSSYLAPGYRYMSDGFGAPVVEGGFHIHDLRLLSMRLGFGYRFIFNEWVKNGLKTESQFFVSAYF